MNILLTTFMLFLCIKSAAFAELIYSKIDQPGCPENAHCQKATGLLRQKWIEKLTLFNQKKISEFQFNQIVQNDTGAPISGWALEEASVLPKIVMWDSPCRQHKNELSKIYISEIFRKDLNASDIGISKNLIFAKIIGKDLSEKIFSFYSLRDEYPLFIENQWFYFLREEEGQFYGLSISKFGDLKVATIKKSDQLPKDAVCPKDFIDIFLKEAPSSTFYQTYICKEVWNRTIQKYQTLLFGKSCF